MAGNGRIDRGEVSADFEAEAFVKGLGVRLVSATSRVGIRLGSLPFCSRAYFIMAVPMPWPRSFSATPTWAT